MKNGNNGFLVLLISTLLLTSCRTIKVDKQFEHPTYAKLELGVLGFQEMGLTRKFFNVKGIPELKDKIKVFVRSEPFTTNSFEAYQNASPKNIGELVYNDSVQVKPSFLSFRIADQVGYINSLNGDKDLQDFLLKQDNIFVVNSISIVFPPELQTEIQEAEALFLSNTHFKQYELQLVKSGKILKSVPFQSGRVFSYGLAYPCWGENYRFDVVVKELVRQHSACSKGLQQDATKVKKKLAINKL